LVDNHNDCHSQAVYGDLSPKLPTVKIRKGDREGLTNEIQYKLSLEN